MDAIRKVIEVAASRPTREGAGVRLQRVFGQVDPRLDPFLLLDHFGSERPEDYLAGFPWHPHRGIETITYMLAGKVEHGDSLGNQGVIGPGDVQWMTAGSGIIHQEMPQRAAVLTGFQLWANLPSEHKMMQPRYRDVKAADIPTARLGDGVEAKVVCRSAGGVQGPVRDIVTDPQYLDVKLAPGAQWEHPVQAGHNAFAYLFEGRASFGPHDAVPNAVERGHLVIFSDGDRLRVEADQAGARLLLVAGKPIREPVAWGGPIVMNTQAELRQAFSEYDDGTFLKHGRTP